MAKGKKSACSNTKQASGSGDAVWSDLKPVQDADRFGAQRFNFFSSDIGYHCFYVPLNMKHVLITFMDSNVIKKIHFWKKLSIFLSMGIPF
jgi:hypothetical protein